jgi:hypothetical protein
MKNRDTLKNTLHGSLDPIEYLTGQRHLWEIQHDIVVSVEKREFVNCPYKKDLIEKHFTWLSSSQIEHVEETLNFLFTKLSPLFPKLEEIFWLGTYDVLAGISARLSWQIQEATQSGRKFTNGTIWSLKSIDRYGNMALEEIPYWAFWSTNVSLDHIKYQTKVWLLSLRQIMENPNIGYKNSETWEFYLPNSLWVSIMIQLSDGTIIAQKRNNAEVLTQYIGLTSSASWAISNMEQISWNITWLRANAAAEVTEELGLSTTPHKSMPSIDARITGNIQTHILRELGLDEWSNWVLVPVWAVMERKRHNPEIIFTLVVERNITLQYIQEKWKNAPDRYESIGIVGITPEQVEKDTTYYQEKITPEQANDPNGLEQFISNLDRNREWTGPHLLMSYLAWKKAIKQISKSKQVDWILSEEK